MRGGAVRHYPRLPAKEEKAEEETEKVLKLSAGEFASCSPREDQQKVKKDKEGGAVEEDLRRALGESAEEVVEREMRGDVGEEAVRARARKTGAVPSEREVGERNLDHAVFRSWRPRCVKGRAESHGHVEKVQNVGEAATVGVDYVYTRSEQEKEEKATANAAPSKGLDSSAVETAKRWLKGQGARRSS